MLTNELLNLSRDLWATLLETEITEDQFPLVKNWFFPLAFFPEIKGFSEVPVQLTKTIRTWKPALGRDFDCEPWVRQKQEEVSDVWALAGTGNLRT